MIFTVAQLQNASFKYLNKYAENLDTTTIRQYIAYYGELSHNKIRNIKNKESENGEFISPEKLFIEHCISQYELFDSINEENIKIAYKCLISGASFIIRLNEKVLNEANNIAENFLREGE